MRWVVECWKRLASLGRRRDAFERRLDEEIRFHVEQQMATYLRAGMSLEEAHHRALLEFGGLVLVTVAIVASYVPARRGMNMAPVDALRAN
jgi:hypothetical protein